MQTAEQKAFDLRNTVLDSDRDAVARVVRSTGNFSADEVNVAVELVDAALKTGAASGYDFLFAEAAGEVAGYACYGPTPCTEGSFDLYWIVVDPARQGRGVAAGLLAAVVQDLRNRSARHLYAETSSRPDYAAARRFYLGNEFTEAARLPDFYRPGDDKLVYCRILLPTSQ